MSKFIPDNEHEEDGDDVAGLFRRLDQRTSRPKTYQVFAEVEPAAAPVRKPAPHVVDVVPEQASPGKTSPGKTPLAELFARLAAAEPRMGGHSPLAQLRSVTGRGPCAD